LQYQDSGNTENNLASLKFECHAIINKNPGAASVVQQVHTVLSDIENLAGCTPYKMEESSEWTSIVNRVEENRVNFCKAVFGKPLFSTLYAVYAVTLNELKAILKVGAQEGQSGAVNETSVDSTAQEDDFHEVKRSKRHISNFKMPPKAVLSHNFFAPLRTADMDIETTEAEKTLQEQEAPRKPGRPPPIVMTSTTELIRLQSDLTRPCQRRVQVPKYAKLNLYHNKRNGGLFSHEILPEEK
jgi:hypothetical protein